MEKTLDKKFYIGDKVIHESGKKYTVSELTENGRVFVEGFQYSYDPIYLKLLEGGEERKIALDNEVVDRFIGARSRARDVPKAGLASLYVGTGEVSKRIGATLESPMVILSLEAYENLCNASPEPRDPKELLVEEAEVGTVLTYTNEQGSHAIAVKSGMEYNLSLRKYNWKVILINNSVSHFHDWDNETLVRDMSGTEFKDIKVDTKHTKGSK